MPGLSKATITTALVAIAAVALVTFVQRKGFNIPVVGAFLPK
jgi:hypothetical protein